MKCKHWASMREDECVGWDDVYVGPKFGCVHWISKTDKSFVKGIEL